MVRKFISFLFFLAIVGTGGYLWLDRGRDADLAGLQGLTAIQDVQASDASKATTTNAPKKAIKIRDMAMGDANAPITMIEYASFTCPHCARFHEEVFPKIKARYIDTGKLRFVVRDVYFDRYGLWAAMLARCGDGSKFFGLSDLIYSRQREWTRADSEAGIVENLRKLGRVAGMTDDQMNACLQDADKARALVETYQKNAERDQIDATPTFIINGKKYPNMSWADFQTTLDGLLAR